MNAPKPKFGFGQVLKEKVTGFTGAVMCITYYSTGCIHYSLLPLAMKDGLVQDWQQFDETRLEDTGIIKDVGPLTVSKPEPKKPLGGPAPRTRQC